MPMVPFDDLPDSSRTWVFCSEKELSEDQSMLVLGVVDDFISRWKAHGATLRAGRDWRLGRFLTVAVDQSSAGASGCSIDGLYRVLKETGNKAGTDMLSSGPVYYLDANGTVQGVDRETFAGLAERGIVSATTRVFDPTVETLGEWRAKFESEIAHSWHQGLMPAESGSRPR